MWVVFDPYDRTLIQRVRWHWMARLLITVGQLSSDYPGLDCVREGEGW